MRNEAGASFCRRVLQGAGEPAEVAWIYPQVSFPSDHTAPVCQLLNSVLYINTHYICSISEKSFVPSIH